MKSQGNGNFFQLLFPLPLPVPSCRPAPPPAESTHIVHVIVSLVYVFCRRDALLQRPEFAECWAVKWSDLLRNEELAIDFSYGGDRETIRFSILTKGDL